MSFILISSEKIIKGYDRFVAEVIDTEQNEIDKAATKLVADNNRALKGCFRFLYSELSYKEAVNIVTTNDDFVTGSYDFKLRWWSEKRIFADLRTAAEAADKISVNVKEFAYIARWING